MGAVRPRSAATRLAAMPGQKRLAGALAAVAAAMAISACGSSGDNQTISPENANELTSALNAVQAAVESRNCDLAEQRAHDFIDAVNALPDTVGTEDKDKLRSAGENLEKLAQDPAQCKPPPPKTGTTDLGGVEPTDTATKPPTTTATTTSSTTTTTTQSQPTGNGGGNEGNGGEPSSGTGGGDTGSGSGGGGGGGGEAGGGSGGTGTGGTGGGGGTG